MTSTLCESSLVVAGDSLAASYSWPPEDADWANPAFLDDLPELILTRTPVSAALFEHLERVDLHEDSGDVLARAMEGWARIEAHAAAQKARFAAEIAADLALEQRDLAGTVSHGPEEVAMLLGITRHAAQRLITVGRQFVGGPLMGTMSAFLSGRISQAKAETIVCRLERVSGATAMAVEDQVLPRAPRRTVPQLDRDIAKALLEVDPGGADVRHELARSKRYVGRPRVAADGMARVSLFLPAEGAITLTEALDSMAQAAKTAGDPRSSDQIRADALCEWAAGACRDGWAFTSCSSVITSAKAQISVTVPLDVLMAAVPGFKPPAALAELIEADIYGAELPSDSVAPVGAFRREAAYLDGYGYIPNAVALLLAAGGIWKRIVTDPVTGLPLDIGRSRYRPPAHLAEAVRLRDKTCVRPGCSVPASRCELDHVVPWAQGGRTAAANLVCLCGRCHRIKTAGGGTPSLPGRGGLRKWLSATGRLFDDGDPDIGSGPPFEDNYMYYASPEMVMRDAGEDWDAPDEPDIELADLVEPADPYLLGWCDCSACNAERDPCLGGDERECDHAGGSAEVNEQPDHHNHTERGD